MKKFFIALFACGSLVCNAQNLDNENINVKYLRYPSDPLPADIKTYTKDVYVGSLSVGQDRSSIENQLSNAISLPGYELVDDGGDLLIRLSLSDFSVVSRDLKIVDKEKKDDDGKVTKWKEYNYEYAYKYPTRLVITNKLTDQELFNDYINGSQDSKAASTTSYRDFETLDNAWQGLINKVRDEARSGNLTTAKDYIQKKHGFTPTSDLVQLKRVKKFKKYEYPRIDEGVEIAKAALASLEPVENYVTDEFKAKIMEAIATFDEVLLEADFVDKKARINEKVASALYNNLAICYYWINDFDKVAEAIDKADGLKADAWTFNMNKELEDKKARYEANGLLNF